MIPLFLTLVILAGLTGAVYLVRSISKDLRGLGDDDEETHRNTEIWRDGK